MSIGTLTDKLKKADSPYYVAVVPINMFEEVLLGLRKEDGIWTTPAGGANVGEQPEDCAVRECFEEAGLIIDKDRLELIGIKTAPNGKPVHCYLYRTEQNRTHVGHDPDEEVNEWIWTNAQDLPRAMKRKKNQNRLETVNEAYMMYHGIKKGDKIPGGLADKKKPSDFDPKLLAQGVKVEMEHTSDKKIATEIAMDHLTEDLKYYDKLKTIEKSIDFKRLNKGCQVFKSGGHEALLEYIQGIRPEAPETASRLYNKYFPKNGKQDTDNAFIPTPKVEKSMENLLDKLQKGGPGSGKRGHQTAQVISLKDKLKTKNSGAKEKIVTKLDEHLNKLTEGAVLENAQTESGKPIFSNMEHATAHGYTVDDHNDAMNHHYDLAQKMSDKISQLESAGHKMPESAHKIKDFHNKKFREHFRTGQKLADRQAKMEEAKKVKKSSTQMGHHESPDLNTGDFATSYVNAKDDGSWLEQLYGLMDGYDYGDAPRELMLDKGMLSLVKVDDGQYTGYFRRHEDGMEDNAKIRIERINLPELVQLLMAKEYVIPMLNELAEPEELEKEGVPSLGQMTPMETSEDMELALPEPIVESNVDRKLEMLRLISKLLD